MRCPVGVPYLPRDRLMSPAARGLRLARGAVFRATSSGCSVSIVGDPAAPAIPQLRDGSVLSSIAAAPASSARDRRGLRGWPACRGTHAMTRRESTCGSPGSSSTSGTAGSRKRRTGLSRANGADEHGPKPSSPRRGRGPDPASCHRRSMPAPSPARTVANGLVNDDELSEQGSGGRDE